MKIESYYDQYWSDQGFCPRGKMRPDLQSLYQRWIPSGASVLDVGCGDGGTSGKWLAANGYRYMGVDISENAVAEARRTGFQATKISDASELPYPSGTFDAVVCIEVLEHLFDPYAAVKEITRVLKPGGIFIATVPNIIYWRNRLDFSLLGRWNALGDNLSVKEPWRDPHIRFFTHASMCRFLSRGELSLIHIGGQEGGFAKSLPFLRKYSRDRASRPYKLLERLFPSVLGLRIEIVCKKGCI